MSVISLVLTTADAVYRQNGVRLMVNACFFSVLDEVNAISSSSSFNLVWLGLASVVGAGAVFYLVNQNKVSIPPDMTAQAKSLSSRIQEETAELTDLAQEKIDSVLDEYKRLLPYLEELGLSVQGFSIEAGLLPQIKTSLRGSIDNIKPEAIERIKAENPTNKLLLAILNAVLLARNCHQKLESVYISILKDIVVDVKLGIPPSIMIRFQ
ncbi:MAG TPA: hypothetical protein V6C65_17415 [Allocoleopsis sp.]